MTNNKQLSRVGDLRISTNPRASKADLTNASHLMGDVFSGDPAGIYGDPDDDYGDVDETGDVSTAAMTTFESLIGDAEETGDLKKVWKGVKRVAPYAAGAAALGFGTAAIVKAIKRRKAQRAAVQANLTNNSRNATIQNQVMARRLMGKIPRTAAMPFYQVTGATLNSYPLAPTEVFASDTLKYNLDRQSTDTPFEVDIRSGTYAGVTWTVTAPGVASPRYYVAVFLVIGISILTANPGTIFTVTGTLPTINGSLVISANPFSFTIRNGYYAKLLIFPWQLVTNKPLLALGSYNNANPIVLNITGLPSNATVSMIVPGSQHVWTIGMRNRLI